MRQNAKIFSKYINWFFRGAQTKKFVNRNYAICMESAYNLMRQKRIFIFQSVHHSVIVIYATSAKSE
jgi:hypothetical protein